MWATNTPSAPSGTFCDGLTTWMRQQMSDEHAGGTMMWSTPAAMLNTCRRWAAHAGTNSRPTAAQCADMVDWMTGHVNDWNGWMMGGAHMMGR